MRLCEKIALLRQHQGWSQEELAEKMDVSRQSVSKWENGSSVPELDRIVHMCEIFGVSADRLINDSMDLEDDGAETCETLSGLPFLTLDEAYAFASMRQEAAQRIGLGVALCVASPAPAMLFGAPGVCLLLLMVACAVWIFIAVGGMFGKFNHVYPGRCVPADDVADWAKSALHRFQPSLTREISLGLALCICCPAPAIFFHSNLGAALLMLLIAAGVYFFVHSGVVRSGYQNLLQL